MYRILLVGLAAATLGGEVQALETAGASPGAQGIEQGASTMRPAGRVRRARATASPDDVLADGAATAPARRARRSSGRLGPGLPPSRPEEMGGAPAAAAAATAGGPPPADPAAAQPAVPSASAEPSTSWFGPLFGAVPAQPYGARLPPLAGRAQIDALIAHHARLNGVPEPLVHRIVVRESKYNPRAVGRGGAMGLMQIKTGTARALGYSGGPMGLLDAETNITYAVKYLAGAYRTADGNHDRAVGYYARGYYYDAKRKGQIQTVSRGDRRSRRRGERAGPDETPPAAAPTASAFPSFFSFANQAAGPSR